MNFFVLDSQKATELAYFRELGPSPKYGNAHVSVASKSHPHFSYLIRRRSKARRCVMHTTCLRP